MFSDGFTRLAPVNLEKRKSKSSRSWTNGRLTEPTLIRRQIDLGASLLSSPLCCTRPVLLVLIRVLVESTRCINFPFNFKVLSNALNPSTIQQEWNVNFIRNFYYALYPL